MSDLSQMLKGVIEGCVLKLLAGESMYAMQIVMAMRKNGFSDFSEGTLYPLLLRLEKEGCFDIHRVEHNSGPPRKYYRLSAAGAERLELFMRDWQTLSMNVDNIISDGGGEDAE